MTYLTGLNSVLKTASKLKWWLVAVLFIGFMAYLFKDAINERLKPSNEVNEGISQAKLVNDVLRQMMDEYNGDRAYVYRFHNGVNYYDGSHKIKSSMDFEVVANGIQPIGLFMQDIPSSLFADQMAAIINGEVMGISLEDTRDKAASAVMVEMGISHAAALPFYDKKGRMVMVIGIDWVNKKHIDFIPDRFRRYVDKVGRMLTNQPSEEIVNLMNRNNYITRASNQEVPEHILEYEERQKAPSINVGLCPDYIASKRARLLDVIANAD